MKPEQNKRIASQFMGHGDPNSPVWIIAFDPIVEWDDKKISAFQDITYTYDNILIELSKYSREYLGYKDILENVFPKFEYQKRYFLSSIKPYGMQTNEQRILESSLFGFRRNIPVDEIFNEIKEARYIAMETFFRSYNWKEKYVIFCGGMNGKIIKPHLLDFLKEIYKSEKLPYEQDEYVENILTDHARKKFIIPDIKYSENSDLSLNKGIIARLKIETA